ncbi:unnamed protein product [Haemonchus placei]|uniref:Uncharacterized protein n=1 Tax=Haemonchus placei TaxID=6290 RepID=A0A0N4WPM7_HAEPC|nr:unnamed protein product [Haemonchus placei]
MPFLENFALHLGYGSVSAVFVLDTPEFFKKIEELKDLGSPEFWSSDLKPGYRLFLPRQGRHLGVFAFHGSLSLVRPTVATQVLPVLMPWGAFI